MNYQMNSQDKVSISFLYKKLLPVYVQTEKQVREGYKEAIN